MFYSLRSLMIVVTLVCVVLARIAYIWQMAEYHEATVQRLVVDLSTKRLVNFDHEDGPPSAERIRLEVDAIASDSPPLSVWEDNYGTLFLKTDFLKRESDLLTCYTPDALKVSLAAIQHQRSAMAYRGAIWQPWRLSIEPPPMEVRNYP